jgi:hypothetical protein
MATTDRDEFSRLILQIERDLMDQARLRTLLTAVDTTATTGKNCTPSKLVSNALRTVRFEHTPALELIDTRHSVDDEDRRSRRMPRVSFPEGRPFI